MLIVKLSGGQIEERESAARFKMSADHALLLRRVNYEKLRLHTHQQRAASGLKPAGIPPIVNPRHIVFKIHHQGHAAIRKQALFVVRLAVAFVKPKQIHEVGKRRPRNVVADEHYNYDDSYVIPPP